MSLISKKNAIKNCYILSRRGFSFLDKIKLFIIGLNNQADWQRRKILLNVIKFILEKCSKDGFLEISLKTPSKFENTKKMRLKLRTNNQADYQSLFECLGIDMYKVPKSNIKYVLDGGGNIGFFSILASFLPDIKEIIIVEPNPNNIELLKVNTSVLHECIKIELYENALDGEERIANFEFASSNTGHIENMPGHHGSSNKIKVQTKPISVLLPDNWDMKRTWIKLDIEGAEYKVLNELFDSGFTPKAMSVEYHDYLNAGGEKSVQNLENFGYSTNIHGYGESGNVCRQVTALNINI